MTTYNITDRSGLSLADSSVGNGFRVETVSARLSKRGTIVKPVVSTFFFTDFLCCSDRIRHTRYLSIFCCCRVGLGFSVDIVSASFLKRGTIVNPAHPLWGGGDGSGMAGGTIPNPVHPLWDGGDVGCLPAVFLFLSVAIIARIGYPCGHHRKPGSSALGCAVLPPRC